MLINTLSIKLMIGPYWRRINLWAPGWLPSSEAEVTWMGVYTWTQPILYTYHHQELQNAGMGVYTRTQPITWIQLDSSESLCVLCSHYHHQKQEYHNEVAGVYTWTQPAIFNPHHPTHTHKKSESFNKQINTWLSSNSISCSQNILWTGPNKPKNSKILNKTTTHLLHWYGTAT